jgi:hypothetical protein
MYADRRVSRVQGLGGRSQKALVNPSGPSTTGLCARAARGVAGVRGEYGGGAGERAEGGHPGRKPYGHYDVLSGDDEVGALILGGSHALAQMICTDGAWLLTTSSFGWELLIESFEVKMWAGTRVASSCRAG